MRNIGAFQFYHPFRSFAEGQKHFVNAAGKPMFSSWGKPNDGYDAMVLWGLGKKAFELLGNFENKEQFDLAYKSSVTGLEQLRILIADLVASKKITVSSDGSAEAIDIGDLSHSQLIEIGWVISRERSDSETDKVFLFFFLFLCLIDIEDAIIAMLEGGGIALAVSAMEHFTNAQAILSGDENLQKVRSESASQAALERYKNDPKQKAKAEVKVLWESWQDLDENARKNRYKSQAAFAKDMLEKFEILENQNVIERWCTQWKGAAK